MKSAVRFVRENIQRTLVPAFHESGVRRVFNRHVHAFEQVDRYGITYITDSTRIPGSVRAIENTLGYSRITVDPQTGMISIDVIREADVSGDLLTLEKIYPEGTVDAEIRYPLGTSFNSFPDFSELMGFLKNIKDKNR